MQEKNKSVAGAEAKVEESQVGQWDALARNMVRLFDEGTKVLGTLVERRNGSGPYSMASEASEATKALGEVAQAMGERAWQARRGAERALQGLCRALGPFGAPLPRRRGCQAGDRAGAWRQSLQGPGLVEHPILRFLEAGLSPHRPLGRGRHPQYRGRRRQDAKARAVLSRADACGVLAVELRLHQPRSGARHALHQRGQSGAGHGASCARPRALEGSVAHQPDRSRRHSRSAGIWR